MLYIITKPSCVKHARIRHFVKGYLLRNFVKRS